MPIAGIGFSATGRELVAGLADGACILFQPSDRPARGLEFVVTRTFQFEGSGDVPDAIPPLTCVVVSPDGDYIACGRSDHRFLVWNSRTGERLTAGDLGGSTVLGHPVRALAFSPDSDRLALGTGREESGAGGHVVIYSIPLGEEQWQTRLRQPCSALTWPEGNLLLTAEAEENSIIAWHPQTGNEPAAVFRGKGDAIRSLAFHESEDEALCIAFGQVPHQAGAPVTEPLETVFDFGWLELTHGRYARERIDTGQFQGANHFGLERIGETKLCKHGTIEIEVRTCPSTSTGGTIREFTLVCPKSEIVVAAGCSLHLFDAQGKPRDLPLCEHLGLIDAIAPSREGHYVVSGGADRIIRLWNAETGELLASLFVDEENQWICWTPEGFFHTSGNRAAGYLGWWINDGFNQPARFLSGRDWFRWFFQPDIVETTIASRSRQVSRSRLAELDLQTLPGLP